MGFQRRRKRGPMDTTPDRAVAADVLAPSAPRRANAVSVVTLGSGGGAADPDSPEGGEPLFR